MCLFKGINDCGDNSDEFGCGNVNVTNSTTTTSEPTTEQPIKECSNYEFMCDSGTCISKPQLCDGMPDCPNGEDEKYCPDEKLCRYNSFR